MRESRSYGSVGERGGNEPLEGVQKSVSKLNLKTLITLTNGKERKNKTTKTGRSDTQ